MSEHSEQRINDLLQEIATAFAKDIAGEPNVPPPVMPVLGLLKGFLVDTHRIANALEKMANAGNPNWTGNVK